MSRPRGRRSSHLSSHLLRDYPGRSGTLRGRTPDFGTRETLRDFFQGMVDWVDGTRPIEKVFADIDAAWAALPP
jgi:hypothetical protein